MRGVVINVYLWKMLEKSIRVFTNFKKVWELFLHVGKVLVFHEFVTRNGNLKCAIL